MNESIVENVPQFVSEKDKIEFEHKLKRREILLEKVLSGLIIVLLGITANIVLEQYKADLTKEKFFLEHKYRAITDIQNAISDIFNKFDKFTAIDKAYKLPENYKNIYRDSLYNLTKVLSSSGALLSSELGETFQYFVFIFSAFNQKDIAKCREYRTFAIQLGDWVYSHLYKELNLDPSNYPADQYKFGAVKRPLFFKIDSEIGVEKFLENEYEKWKLWGEKE